MNGVVSTSMQKRGLDYKLNYGVSVLILKDMAKNLPKDHLLAQLLWSKEVREMKILATMIQPTDQFTTPIANRWVESIVFAEQAEQACLNLFQHLPQAKDLAMDWLSSDSDIVRFTTWHLLARLAKKRCEFTPSDLHQILSQALLDLESDQLNRYNGALLALKRIGADNKEFANTIIDQIKKLPLLNSTKKQQLIDDLTFEFEYYASTSL